MTRVEPNVGRLFILLGGMAVLSGCFPQSDAFSECRDDADCGGGAQCTRTNECVSGTLLEVRINWTVNGQTVTPQSAQACYDALIDHLSVGFSERSLGELSYTPVPCELGQTYYDRMPPRFDRVSLSAHGPNGELLDAISTSVGAGENVVDFDLVTN